MPQPTAIIEDLERRRARLTDGKCLDLVASRMPRPLAMEVREAAKRAGTTVSDWLMQAALEKMNDEIKTAAQEMLAEARKMKPQGISDGLWNEIIRDTIDKIGKPKRAPTMFTSESDAVNMLLQEAATWHAEAAHAPEKAPQLLAEYLRRYQTDAAFRAEIDAGVKESLKQAERLKARTLPLDTSKAQQ